MTKTHKASGKPQDELLELVDDSGAVVGTELRSQIWEKHLPNFRVVDVFVQNKDGQTFIMKRASDKKIFPNAYECCGEHVHPGESDRAAARRGVYEEMQIDIPEDNFIFLGYTTPALDNAVGYVAVFKVVTDRQPVLGREHGSGQWMTHEEISQLLRKDPRQFRSNVLLHISKFARELF